MSWRKNLKQLLVFAVVFGVILSWIFMLNLSGSFFQGNQTVMSATLFTAANAAGMLVSFVILNTERLERRYRNHPNLLFLAGSLILTCFSLLQNTPLLIGMKNLAAVTLSGVVVGCGLMIIALAVIVFVSGIQPIQAAIWLGISLAMGITVFLLYEVLVPDVFTGRFSWILTLAVSIGTVFIFFSNSAAEAAEASSETFTNPVSLGSFKDLFETKEFLLFVSVTGFLFSYCFNIYPKSTRFVGVFSEAILGLIGNAGLCYVLAALVSFCLFVFVAVCIRKYLIPVFGCFLVISLAVLYFSFPFMPNNWYVFILLENLGTCALLFALVGCLSFFNDKERKRFRVSITSLLKGSLLGSVLALLFIETTTPQPYVYLPETAQDVIIVGVPFIGFIILMSILMVLANNALLPRIPDVSEIASVSMMDLKQRCSSLAIEYGLTKREEEIFCLLAQGRSGSYIQEDLYLSKSTVKTHIRHIYGKLSVQSRQQLISLVIK
jgi:DNA-binding CsgD family transcriptional regulator